MAQTGFVEASGMGDDLKAALKFLRLRAGLTQEQVAERLGIIEGREGYSRIERTRGRWEPLSLTQMELVAAALDSNLPELLEIEKDFRKGGRRDRDRQDCSSG